MTDPTARGSAQTSDMLGVHRVFREAFDAGGALVGGADPGDAARVDLVAAYYANVMALLHAHHEGEDDLVYPKLAERSDATELVARVGAQHVAVTDLMAAAEAALGTWSAAPSAATAQDLTAALATLGADLADHLDEEETAILPLCAALLSQEEWGQLPGHSLRAFAGDRVWLAIGLIREQMTDEERANMLANMPPPVVEMWTTTGNAAFDEFVADLRA